MRRFPAMCLGLVCLAGFPASGQTSTGGSIRGHAKDELSAVLPAVRITATSPDAPTEYAVESDNEGYYRLLDLPPGTYALTAELDGFAKWRREDILVRAGLNLSVDIIMHVGSLNETVKVELETPLIETFTPVQAVNISGTLQRAVPLSSRRDWSDFLLMTPSVISSARDRTVYYLHGATQDSHVLQVDGADVTPALAGNHLYMNLSTEALSDVQIKTSAVDASAPLGVGAVVNVVTNSGSDAPAIAISFAGQPRQWNDSNRVGGSSPYLTIWQGDASAGGPLRRERAWFYSSYRWTKQEIGIDRTPDQLARLRAVLPTAALPDANVTDGHFLFAKATARLSPRHHVQLLFTRDSQTRTSAAPIDAELFLDTRDGGPLASSRTQSTWDRWLLRTTLTYNRKGLERSTRRSDVPGQVIHTSVFPSAGRLVGTGGIAQQGSTTFGAIDFPSRKWSASVDVTYYRRLAGEHEVQAGLFLQPRIHDEWRTKYHNNGFVFEELVASGDAASTRLIPFHRRTFDVSELATREVDTRDNAVYIQDIWRLSSRLTVSGGVRIDFVKRVDRIFDEVTQRSTEVGPRVGLNYGLTGAATDVIRASWGRVHENVSVNQTTAGAAATGFVDTYDLDLDGRFETVFSTPGRTALASDLVIDLDNYHQTHIDEATIGYRRQWRGNFVSDVSLTRREYRDIPTSVGINSIFEGGVFRGYRDERFNEIYRVTSNRWNWPIYSGLEFRVSHQSRRGQLIASYAKQWRNIAGTWQPNDPAAFIQPEAFDNDRGIGPLLGAPRGGVNSLSGFDMTNGIQWRDHVASAGGTLTVPGAMRFAAHYTFKSGMWTGPIVTRIAAPDSRLGPPSLVLSNGRLVSNPLATTIRFAFPTRGDGQHASSGVHQLNLRISRRFAIGRAVLDPAFDILNIANAGADDTWNAVGANQTFSPTYLTTSFRQPPRTAQVLCRLSF